MKKLTPQEDAKLLKNRIKALLGTYQYIDTDLPHGSEYMRRNKSVEDNKLGYSILYGIVLAFGLIVCAVIFGMWIWQTVIKN